MRAGVSGMDLSSSISRIRRFACQRPTLFIGEAQIEKSWEFLQPILDARQSDPTVPLAEYPTGSWGPKQADDLIQADGRVWQAL
jgi:glucose-6-phosphate 1-dehydrogenase